MSDPAFTAVKRHLYRQNLIIFGSAALAVLLGIVMVVAVLEVLAHERANLQADFTATMAYIHEQEQFLRKLQAQNQQTSFLASSSLTTTPVIPVSLLKTTDTPLWQSMYPAVVNHLTQYYALFWSFSDFPADHLLVLEQNDTIRLTVPALDISAVSASENTKTETMDAALLEQVLIAAQPYFIDRPLVASKNQPLWLPLPDHAQRMLALLPAALPISSNDDESQTAPTLWLAMVLNHQRLQAQIDSPMLEKHHFSLYSADGRQVLGATDTLPLTKTGFRFHPHGLTLCFEQAQWHGCYRISYASFIGANVWLLLLAVPLLLAGTVGSLAYLRWFRHQVIDPAQQAQRALVQAKTAAQAADQAKTLFLATMSHEIRTPLYALLGSLELLALTHLQSQQQRYVARIQHAAHLLMQQINDILDINRIEAGQMTLQPTLFNVQQWLHDTVAIYKDQAQQKNVALVCHCDPDIPAQLLGDSARLGQILCNLLSNAIKFTDSGHVSVRLTQQSRNHSHCGVYLEVSDTGKGIPAEHFDGLFTPFYLPENGDTRQGAGLGLSICQRLAHLMGSQIQVASVLGQGSRFSLYVNLPIGTENLASLPEKPMWQPHRLRVLIAEDNPFNRATLKDQLQQLGCQVDVAADGNQALAHWTHTAFDALLVDVNMPGLDGCELVRRLRAQGARQPMIGISANALPGEQQRCLDSGMNAWLSKPMTLAQLSSSLQQFCPYGQIKTTEYVLTAPAADHHSLFVATMNEDMQQLRHHLAKADTRALLHHLHRMRGALAVIGANKELVADVGAIQEAVLQHGLDDIQKQVLDLSARLQTWLDHISETPSATAMTD